MKKFAIALAIVALAAVSAQAQVSASLADGSLSIVTDGDAPVAMSGLDIKSAGGLLTPIDPPVATPFAFFLSNTASNVAFAAAPGSTAMVSTGDLSIGYTGDAAGAEADLSMTFGDAAFAQVSFPVTTPAVVPEPAAGLMSAFAALGLLGLRRRR